MPGRAQLTVNNTTFNFICTHFDAWTQANRISAANTLVSTMAGLTGPCVLVGDMNATPGSTEINTLMNACDEVWREAVTAGTATSYPDNPPVTNVYTQWGHIDYIFRTRTQTVVTTLSANIPDLRDPFTYSTNPNGPRNSIGDLLAIGLFTGDATYGSNVMNTHDDLGIRPSDHNQVKAILKVGP